VHAGSLPACAVCGGCVDRRALLAFYPAFDRPEPSAGVPPIKEATAIAMAVAVVNVQILLRLRMVCLPFGA